MEPILRPKTQTSFENYEKTNQTPGEIISDWALPFGVLLLTCSLFGVLYLVGKGRRADVKNRLAEQSSLISVLQDED